MSELETGFRWWVRYVIVPVFGGGGVIALVIAFVSNQPESRHSEVPHIVSENEGPVAIGPGAKIIDRREVTNLFLEFGISPETTDQFLSKNPEASNAEIEKFVSDHAEISFAIKTLEENAENSPALQNAKRSLSEANVDRATHFLEVAKAEAEKLARTQTSKHKWSQTQKPGDWVVCEVIPDEFCTFSDPWGVPVGVSCRCGQHSGVVTGFISPASDLDAPKAPKNPIGVNEISLRLKGQECGVGETFANETHKGTHRYRICYKTGTDRYLAEIHNYGQEDPTSIFGWKPMKITGNRKTLWARYASPDEMEEKGWYPSEVHISYSNNCSKEVTGKTGLTSESHLHGDVNATLCVKRSEWP